MSTTVELPMRAAARQRLSGKQKQVIAMLARAAWDRVPSAAKSTYESEAEWRHEQAILACGRRISEAVNADYGRLKARFLDLAGQPAAAMETLLRDNRNDQRIARYKLDQALAAAGLDESYAAAICRAQNKCTLSDATAQQLWRLLFTIRNRR